MVWVVCLVNSFTQVSFLDGNHGRFNFCSGWTPGPKNMSIVWMIKRLAAKCTGDRYLHLHDTRLVNFHSKVSKESQIFGTGCPKANPRP